MTKDEFMQKMTTHRAQILDEFEAMRIQDLRRTRFWVFWAVVTVLLMGLFAGYPLKCFAIGLLFGLWYSERFLVRQIADAVRARTVNKLTGKVT